MASTWTASALSTSSACNALRYLHLKTLSIHTCVITKSLIHNFAHIIKFTKYSKVILEPAIIWKTTIMDDHPAPSTVSAK